MDIESTPEYLAAVHAANQVARRAGLLRLAAGPRKWWSAATFAVIYMGTLAYMLWRGVFSEPWSVVVLILLLFIASLESQVSRRLDAIVKLLEEPDNRE